MSKVNRIATAALAIAGRVEKAAEKTARAIKQAKEKARKFFSFLRGF